MWVKRRTTVGKSSIRQASEFPLESRCEEGDAQIFGYCLDTTAGRVCQLTHWA